MFTRFKPPRVPDGLHREIAQLFNELKEKHYLRELPEDETDDFNAKEIAGWFLGTRGENAMMLTELVVNAVQNIAEGRQTIFPHDPNYVDGEVKASASYKKSVRHVKEAAQHLAKIINKYSLPFPSMRYQGQMNWDVTLPAMAGYFITMLQNPNNVAFQGGPATTYLEIAVAKDICKMIGFDEKMAWAHIACDGTIANIEGLWSARELRFFPVAVHYAVANDPIYKQMSDIQVNYKGKEENMLALDPWGQLNLCCDDILLIPTQITEHLWPAVFTNPAIPQDWKDQLKDTPEKDREAALEGLIWDDLTKKYSLNARGPEWFYSDYGCGLRKAGIAPPTVVVPSTKHYSWPKGASLLGMGHGTPLTEAELKDPAQFAKKAVDQGFLNVFVDEKGRMKTELLETVLSNCETNHKPVILVVAVQGSTEESAVDPLHKILDIRERTRNYNGFDFNIHADAAWGGYLLSIFREPFDMPWPSELPLKAGKDAAPKGKEIELEIKLRKEVEEAMLSICRADSVTIDPHKWGYVPYAAGSLSYRNGKIVNLVTFGAPYIGSDNSMAEGIGESGVEGSKPGAAAAGTFLSHMVIRPNKEGYGKIINQALLNARMFYIYVAGMKEDGFEVVPFNPLPDEYGGRPVLDYIRDTFYQDKPLKEILQDPTAWDFVNSIGPDQTIVDYIFKIPGDGSLDNLQKLSKKIFDKVYPKLDDDGILTPAEDCPVFLSMTTFHREDYGDDFMTGLARRLGLDNPESVDKIPCMRSVVMDPWAVETKHQGQENYNFFKETFIPQLSKVVKSCL